MADLININTKDAKEKLMVINRNFILITVIVFGGCIAYLFSKIMNINGMLYEYLKTDLINTTRIIENNTAVIQLNTESLNDLKETLKQAK